MKIRQGHLGDHIQTAASIYKMGDLSAMKQDLTAAKYAIVLLTYTTAMANVTQGSTHRSSENVWIAETDE
jgi:hypothetical protein